jgi:magnesium chelatase family protein
MTRAETMETTRIPSVAGEAGDHTALVTTRPFRTPHHTISDVGLIGGGHVPMPGDVSLAHYGVLFLDELPECRRHVLEVLRRPLEDGVVTIERARMLVLLCMPSVKVRLPHKPLANSPRVANAMSWIRSTIYAS